MLYEETRTALLRTVLNLYKKNLIQYNSGNVSVRVSSEHIAITPRGIPYDDMTAEDMVIIDLNGAVIEGVHTPSSEMPMHTAVYKNMSHVNAVIHSHSPYALAFAVVGKSIPVVSTEGLAVRGPIPVAEYACPGTEEQGLAAIKAMKGPPTVTGVLLKNHGVLATGTSLSQAYSIACRIEMAAQVFFLSSQIGNPDILTDEQIKEIKHVYLKK
ncbi:MAG: class II aldolase/adducin family protein [Syntrophaceae bacterium]